MKTSVCRISLLIVCLISFFWLSSCKKDPYQVGTDILPATDTLNLNSSDTTCLFACSELQDSIRSDKTSTFPLGSLMDPVYGKTTASFYTQFVLASTSYDFGENPVLDSVVLCLQYSSLYGNKTTPQTVKVYEVDEALSTTQAYYTNQRAKVYPTLLASKTFRPAITDSVKVYGVKVAPHLRINLNQFTNYFGYKLIATPSGVITDETLFAEYMRGLCIESSPVNNNGALIQFSPLGTQTKLVVYYHNTDVGDSLQCIFALGSASARFSHIDHNNYLDASPEFRQQVLNHDSTLGKSQLYLQGLGGVRIKVRIPNLKDYVKSDPIAVNNALLVLKNITTDTTLAPPPQLALMKLDSTGYTSYLIDESEGSLYFGGFYNTTARTYSFRITRYIQSILTGGQKNCDLYITVNNPSKSLLDANRIVVNGTQPQVPYAWSDRVQLQLIFTRSSK